LHIIFKTDLKTESFVSAMTAGHWHPWFGYDQWHQADKYLTI